MSDKYYLNEDHSYTPCDLLTWATQFKTMDNHVASDKFDGYHVSTIWLGLDHNYQGMDKPLVFETMVFDERNYGDNIYLARYTTWDEAIEGHQTAIEWTKLHSMHGSRQKSLPVLTS